MIRSALLWLLALASALATRVSIAQAPTTVTPPAESATEINLAVGESQTVSASDVKSYSVATEGIAEIKLTPTGAQFVVVGRGAGTTTLLLIHRDGTELTWNINVFARPPRLVAGELRQLLGDQTGIAIKRIGARFFIEGGVNVPADLERIERIAALYEGQVVSLVVLGGPAAVRKINIRIDFYFVQYDKSRSRQLGIDWPAQIGGGFAEFAYDFVENAVASATAVVAGQPLPALDLAARSGWAKVLKHATVITSNGSEASFSSGGVQNFAVIGGLSNSIHPIKFGTDVQVLPRFDPESREIAVGISADVADLTPPVGATDIPGQNLSKLTTNVALKLGQSVVLSGIRTSDEQHDDRGLPWLSEIPVFGLLFGTEGMQMHEVEGALFIVPSVLDSASAQAADLIQHTLADYQRFDGDVDEVNAFEERPSGKRRPAGGTR